MVTDMIWGAGMPGWQTIQWWQRELPGLNTNTYVEPAPEIWHYALAGKSYGPYSRKQLVSELKTVHQIGEVMLWTKGMKEWAHLFEFHDILTDVGINKRIFPRADLRGKGVVRADGLTLVADLQTISEGGVSMALDTGDLVSGQNVTIEIQSPSFNEVLHARAEVRYVSNGVVGFRFTNINSESKAAIVQLVRQSTARFVLKAA